jgi:hypothetical protein
VNAVERSKMEPESEKLECSHRGTAAPWAPARTGGESTCCIMVWHLTQGFPIRAKGGCVSASAPPFLLEDVREECGFQYT